MSYKQLKIWRSLKRKPNSTSAEVASNIGWKTESVRQVLARMCESGSVTWTGPYWRRIWAATDKRPEDGRGTTAASLAQLIPEMKHWRRNLEKAHAAKGNKPKKQPPRVAIYATELEKCWGLRPFSGTFDTATQNLHDFAGRVAPTENTEAAR